MLDPNTQVNFRDAAKANVVCDLSHKFYYRYYEIFIERILIILKPQFT